MAEKYLRICCVAVLLAGAMALEWKHLHLNVNNIFTIPLTKTKALEEDYSLLVSDNDIKVDFYAYKGDPRVTIGYDRRGGNIAGVRIFYIKSDLSKTGEEKGLSYDYSLFENDAMYSTATYNGTVGYINTILFIDPSILKLIGGRKGVATTVGTNVYVKLNGVWTKAPKDECDATSQGFNDAACFATMGKHYFYGLESDMDCNDFKGLFMMYDQGEIVGLGVTVVGSHTDGPSRQWFESPTSTVYQVMMPTNRPSCLTTSVDNFGTTSLHFFFNESPKNITCPSEETKCNN